MPTKFEPVKEGERIVADFPNSLKPMQEEIDGMWEEMNGLLNKAQKIRTILEAKTTIFWDLVSKTNEITESANDRGLAIGIRTKDSSSSWNLRKRSRTSKI